MPEGDTVHKLAHFLDAALRGCMVGEVRLHPAFGQSRGALRVDAVRAEGKHLFIAFAGGLALRSHLGLYGSWHRYRPGEVWRKPARQAGIVLVTDDWHFVCFNAKEAEWLNADGPRCKDSRRRTGPDLIAAPPEPDRLLARLDDVAPGTLLVDLLLDQRVAAGIGNVYKSELLFIEGCAPTLTLAETPPETLIALYRRAASLLRANLGGGPRQTRTNRDGRGNLWVYARRGLPCLRCGTDVQRAMLGAPPRPTYWCPRCQPPPTGAS